MGISDRSSRACWLRSNSRRATSNNSRVLRNMSSTEAHQVRRAGFDVAFRSSPRSQARHDVVDELLASAEAVVVAVVFAARHKHPCL